MHRWNTTEENGEVIIGSAISANITPFKDFSLYLRGKIIGKVEEGKRLAHIAKELKILDFTIRDIILLDLLRDKSTSKTRPDRPNKYSD